MISFLFQISPRPIVSDGSNVAFAHGEWLDGSNERPIFSSRGIDICVDYFKRRGHEDVVAIVPQFRQKAGQAREQHILHKLHKSKNLIFTPSRDLPDGTRIQAYDDRYVVNSAALNGGVIVSNDNFRDLFNETREIRETIQNRVLPFTFFSKDILHFPIDPMGKNGPHLDNFLKF